MIEIRDLALDSPDGSWLLDGLDLAVSGGGNCLITGPSGCGKSRLLKVVAGTERPARGRVRVGGREIWPGDGVLSLAARVCMGFAFASGGLLSNLSLRENVALPLRFRGIPAEEVRVRTEVALEHLGLQPVADLRPHALSASARKQGNLARVMAQDPELILLDEPLEGLDAADRGRALTLIRRWLADPAKTLLIALEDPGPFAELASERLELRAASIPPESP
ncbi:MAG TPA: ATP-binding cassette domain-containing protein [Geothrix sp.]|nr:ATP-binding cassette domain-containing protein [Geothrix sp.]